MEAHRVVRRLGFNIFFRQSVHRWQWGCQVCAPTALYPPGRSLVLISVRDWVDRRAIVRLVELDLLKYPVVSLGIEPAIIVHQPTTRLRAPPVSFIHNKLYVVLLWCNAESCAAKVPSKLESFLISASHNSIHNYSFWASVSNVAAEITSTVNRYRDVVWSWYHP
jgi:hypothetical protein